VEAYKSQPSIRDSSKIFEVVRYPVSGSTTPPGAFSQVGEMVGLVKSASGASRPDDGFLWLPIAPLSRFTSSGFRPVGSF